MSYVNLDQHAALAAQRIISQTKVSSRKEDIDNVITKALGVLQENGIYACTLYLLSRSNKTEVPIAKQAMPELFGLLDKPLNLGKPANSDYLAHISGNAIAGDLDTLLLVKEVWEQTLIYARYGAKALPEDRDKTGSGVKP
jgi:hypothetical protein